jgi:hypothetical protein
MPIERPCDSMNANLWREFACEFIQRGDDPTKAAKNADLMLELFFSRYPINKNKNLNKKD